MKPFKEYLNRKREDKNNRIHLGKIKGEPFKKEYLTEAQLNHHVHVLGASGFGKTVLLMNIIKQKISHGKGLMFLDLKNDSTTINEILRHAESVNRLHDVELFSLSDLKNSKCYNLFHSGTATQLRDKVMMSLNWSEEFYKNQAASYLLDLMIGLVYLRESKGREFDFYDIYKCVTSAEHIQNLIELVDKDSTEEKIALQEAKHFLMQKDNYGSLQGLRSQLHSLVKSDFGKLLRSGSQNGISLFSSVMSSKIILFILDSRSYGETAKVVGRLILQDLKAVSAKVDDKVERSLRRPFNIIIDEFADLAQEDFIAFLDRARSSKMSVVVSHQEIADLERVSKEFAGRLLGNTAATYCFLQKRPESAELIAGIAGTKEVKEETIQVDTKLFFRTPTGMRSLKYVERFIVHPNEIKSLKVGECVVIKKYPFAHSHFVRVSTG